MPFRPLNLPNPPSPSLYKLSIDEFKGVDKASGEDNFSPSRATELKNFIRNKVGQVKKRGGFQLLTGDEGELHWVRDWEDVEVSFVGTSVRAGAWRVTTKVARKLNGNQDGATFEVLRAVGESMGKYFYLLLRGVLTVDETGTEKNVAVRIGKTEGQITDEDFLIYEIKTEAFPTTSVAASLGPVGSAVWKVSSIVSAAMAVRGKYNKALSFMEHVPTPTIVSNASPKGGGNLFQSPNLLSPYVQETFCVTAGDLSSNVCKRFQLSLQNIALTDGTDIISAEEWMTAGTYWTLDESTRKLTAKGAVVLQKSVRIENYVAVDETDYEWQPVDLNKVFTENSVNFVNTASAALWIPAAEIGASPVEGEANVRITYIRNHDEYLKGLQELLECDQTTCYGVGGYKDRLFLAGGNKIFYSGMDDPMYFGELCYIEPCSADKKIVAIGGQGQFLYAVDSDGITHVISGITTEDDTDAYLLDAAFVIADRVQGEKPVGNVLKVFGGEFCYLSQEGVVAIRHDDFYDKRYAQNRSRLLGSTLKGKIVGATVWGSFLVIATQTQLYLLDELQQTRLEDYKYSGVQYEVFPFTFDMSENGLGKFTINKIWSRGTWLFCQIYQNECYHTAWYREDFGVDSFSRSDDEIIEADIIAEWITPPFALDGLHRKKKVQEFWLAVGEEGDAVSVEYRTDNGKEWRVVRKDWGTLRQADGRFVVFDYSAIDYDTFSYNGKVPKLQMSVRGRPSRPFNTIQFRFVSKGQHGLMLTSFGFYYKKEVI